MTTRTRLLILSLVVCLLTAPTLGSVGASGGGHDATRPTTDATPFTDDATRPTTDATPFTTRCGVGSDVTDHAGRDAVARTPGVVAGNAGVAGEATPTRPGWARERQDLAVALGDVAVVPLQLPAGGNATVHVSGPTGYDGRVRVTDDGDGRARLALDTYLAGNDSRVAPGTYRAVGATVTSVGGTTTPRVTPGNYTVTVRVNDNVGDRRTVRVEPPAVRNLTAYRAPAELFDATEPATVRETLNDSARRLSGATPVVAGETLVFRFDAPSLLGVVAAPDDADDRFPYGPNGTDGTGAFSVFGPCGGLSLERTAEVGAVRAVPDYEAGVVSLLVDTGRAEGLLDGGQTAQLELSGDGRLATTDRELETRFRFESPDRVLSIGLGEGANGTAVEITGESNRLPGATVPVRIESRLDPTVSVSRNLTVRSNGTFEATVPVGSSAPYTVFVAGEPYQLTAPEPPSVGWSVVDTVERPLVAPGELSFGDRTTVDGDVLVAYVADWTNGTYRYLGESTGDGIFLRESVATDRIVFVLHDDRDHDGEFDGIRAEPPVRHEGRPVADWLVADPTGDARPAALPALVSPETVRLPSSVRDTSTPSPTDTPPDTEPSTDTVTESPTAIVTEPTPRTGVTTPGFGAGLLVVALLLVAFFTRRVR